MLYVERDEGRESGCCYCVKRPGYDLEREVKIPA